jgi:sterol desaturase/sphingolipid hydroxylase (fatty acid hydroxylase superfamily)
MEVIKILQQNLHPVAFDAARVGIWLLLLAAIFIPLERLFAQHPQKVFRKNFATDIGYYFFNSLVPKLILIVLLSKVASILVQYGPTGFYAWVAGLPIGYRFLAAIVVGEIGAYWGHRCMHQIPFLWRFHAVHHSAEELDWLVNTRAHPLDMVFTRACGLMPIYALGLAQPTGLSDSVAMSYALFGTLWSFVIHANVRWRFGLIEQVISTPAFHHWHHTKDGPTYIDKNYAAIFPWVDRVFGTFYLPKEQWPHSYGVDQPVIVEGIIGQLVQPFQRQDSNQS